MNKIINPYIHINKVKINIFSIFTLFILLINESFISIILILISIVIHELGHIITIYLFKVEIKSIDIEPFGCSINIDELSGYKKDIIISLAGPLNGLLLSLSCAFLNFYFDSVYLFYLLFINLIYSTINLIPCRELDGGKIIESILYLKFDPIRSYKIIELINTISSITLITLTLYYCIFTNFNFSLTSLCIYILIVYPNKNKTISI